MNIKPIETVYNGYRFRSRLEARWAVFFDALGIEYVYEKEGYDLGAAGWYLPDFWLPQVNMWAEVKPLPLNHDEFAKCEALVSGTGYTCILLVGEEVMCRSVDYIWRVPGAHFKSNHPYNIRAAKAARSARFEYGESGAL